MAKGKRCADCGRHRGIGQFNPNVKMPDGLQTLCRECMSARLRKGQRAAREARRMFRPEFPGGKVFTAPASAVTNAKPKQSKRRSAAPAFQRALVPPAPDGVARVRRLSRQGRLPLLDAVASSPNDAPATLEVRAAQANRHRLDLAMAHLGLARLVHPHDDNLRAAEAALITARFGMVLWPPPADGEGD